MISDRGCCGSTKNFFFLNRLYVLFFYEWIITTFVVTASGVDEDMLFSRSRSIEEWEEELEERPRDVEQEIDLVNTKPSATQNRNFHRQNSNRALRKLLSQSLTEDGTQQ